MPDNLADRLFAAIEHGDGKAVGKLWTEDVAVWQSGDTQDNDRVGALKVIRWFIGITTCAATRS